MTDANRLTDRIRRGEAIPAPLALALSACTPLTRAGMWWRLRQPPTRVNAHVISYGNITAGGTGKTPAVIERAQRELAEGHRVAVLTRGYGSSGPAEADSSAIPPSEQAKLLGDEAALLLQKAPHAVVIKNADRIAGANQAVAHHRCDVLLLDDGYQFTQLARDENVLLIDAANPFGIGALIPRGILRESLTAMARATHILLTRCDQAVDLDALTQTIHAHAPDIPIRRTCHAPTTLRNLGDGQEEGLAMLQGKRIAAACAIGHPESFFATLESLGATVEKRLAYPDHAAIPPEALPREGIVVMTEKDAVRGAYSNDNAYALGIALTDIDTLGAD